MFHWPNLNFDDWLFVLWCFKWYSKATSGILYLKRLVIVDWKTLVFTCTSVLLFSKICTFTHSNNCIFCYRSYLEGVSWCVKSIISFQNLFCGILEKWFLIIAISVQDQCCLCLLMFSFFYNDMLKRSYNDMLKYQCVCLTE